MRYIIIVILICMLLTSVTSCQVPPQREGPIPDWTIKLFKDLQAVNTASAPLNPYALPVGAGLAGVIAMLESLRRVEKGKRKYAEHELNNNKNNHT